MITVLAGDKLVLNKVIRVDRFSREFSQELIDIGFAVHVKDLPKDGMLIDLLPGCEFTIFENNTFESSKYMGADLLLYVEELVGGAPQDEDCIDLPGVDIPSVFTYVSTGNNSVGF